MLNLRMHYNLLCEKDYAAEGLWYEQLSGYRVFSNGFFFTPVLTRFLISIKYLTK